MNPKGQRQPNAWGTGNAGLMLNRGVMLRSTSDKKAKAGESWWNVPEDRFAEAAAAERDRLANVDSPPSVDKSTPQQMRRGRG